MGYRKIGGIHWVSIGRCRFAFCVTQRHEIIPAPSFVPFAAAVGLYALLWWSYWG